MTRAADPRDTGRRTEQLLAAIHAAKEDVRVDLAVSDLGWLLERITRLEDALAKAERDNQTLRRLCRRLLSGEVWGALASDGSGRTLEDEVRAALAEEQQT